MTKALAPLLALLILALPICQGVATENGTVTSSRQQIPFLGSIASYIKALCFPDIITSAVMGSLVSLVVSNLFGPITLGLLWSVLRVCWWYVVVPAFCNSPWHSWCSSRTYRSSRNAVYREPFPWYICWNSFRTSLFGTSWCWSNRCYYLCSNSGWINIPSLVIFYYSWRFRCL